MNRSLTNLILILALTPQSLGQDLVLSLLKEYLSYYPAQVAGLPPQQPTVPPLIDQPSPTPGEATDTPAASPTASKEPTPTGSPETFPTETLPVSPTDSPTTSLSPSPAYTPPTFTISPTGTPSLTGTAALPPSP